MDFDRIPSRLKTEALWNLWKLSEGKNGITKIPINPHTQGNGQSNNPATFGDFEKVKRVFDNGTFGGMGIFIGKGFGAIDIDDCVGPDGQPDVRAQDIISTVGSYTEFSPSGKGIRIIFITPPEFIYNTSLYYINKRDNWTGRKKPKDKKGIEIYVSGSTNKFVTITGNAINNSPIKEITNEIDQIAEKYMKRKESSVPKEEIVNSYNPQEAWHNSQTDEEILIKASKNPKFNKLYYLGDISNYPSQSEADQALSNLLAYYTNKNFAQMDRLYRQSTLYREKWDEKRGSKTYGEMTLEKAIANGVIEHPKYTKITNDQNIKKLKDFHPEKNEKYPWTELGFGCLFADFYKDICRYVPERKSWFVFDGRVWVKNDQRAKEIAKEFARALNHYAADLENPAEYAKAVHKWHGSAYRETMLREAQSVHPISLADFDNDPNLLNCLNGTLNLLTGELHEHDPSELHSKVAKVKFIPGAMSERLNRFISEIMLDDSDKAEFLQKALGYALSGNTDFECFFILYGMQTRNGKGTLMETFRAMLGDYAKSANPETIALKYKSNGSGPSEDIARLRGARFINISEPEKNLVFSSATIKTITGNDTITARYLNENSFEFKMVGKIFINTNYLPTANDPTIFDSGRVMVIPFDRHFDESERDIKLKQQLRSNENLSALLNWSLEGFHKLQESGFTMPLSVKNATSKYQDDSDKVGNFIKD